MPRAITANRLLLLLMTALACLAAPSAAGGASYSVNAQVTGTLGSNGWYVSNVSVSWQFDPNPPDTVTGCFIGTITAEGGKHIDCKVSWIGGPTIDYPLDISIDKTAPAVQAVPSRRPDANGWYDKPVSFSFTGTDATSGVASCSSTFYSGPDNGNASVEWHVQGQGRDAAGSTHSVRRDAADCSDP